MYFVVVQTTSAVRDHGVIEEQNKLTKQTIINPLKLSIYMYFGLEKLKCQILNSLFYITSSRQTLGQIRIQTILIYLFLLIILFKELFKNYFVMLRLGICRWPKRPGGWAGPVISPSIRTLSIPAPSTNSCLTPQLDQGR